MQYNTEKYQKISMYIWHFASKWYTIDLNVVTLNIKAFVSCCHQALYPGVNRNFYQVFVTMV